MNKAKYAGIGEIFRKENKHNAKFSGAAQAASNEAQRSVLQRLVMFFTIF